MCRCFDFEAWYDRMPGADSDILHVAGKCEVSSSSFKVTLQPDNEGIIDDPELVALRVVVEKPEVHDRRIDTKEVSYRVSEPGVKRVRINAPESGLVTVEVRDVH